MTRLAEGSATASDLAARYSGVRTETARLCDPLEVEDFGLQSMVCCSPVKWHLAHTSWFFETFVLRAALPGYRSPDPHYAHLFNSYYESIGNGSGRIYPRAQRDLLSRPTVREVQAYRQAVDRAVLDLLADRVDPGLAAILELGIHHEQQHQELILTDLKHAFFCNPLAPVYSTAPASASEPRPVATAPHFLEHPGGLVFVGHEGRDFAFDNEGPSHRVFLEPFEVAAFPVTNHEYAEFIADGGYERPELWLSAGWAKVQSEGWSAPLYWRSRAHGWEEFTLGGWVTLDPGACVCHVSYYEAEAFARWARRRLPTEAEWETAAKTSPAAGTMLESRQFHPRAVTEVAFLGGVWNWTQSAYAPYPGYRPPAGALGEYNGKFMCSQMVLRGGSCVTPRSHIRTTYRNFFYPEDRWQFSGIRLAGDA